MNNLAKNTYRFNDFLFDADKLALYYRNELIRNVGEKSLQVLAVLLQNANELSPHEEIIKQVWLDNPSGVDAVHIAQNIKKLRKVLKDYEPDRKFIENVKGRGYMFVGEVSSEEIEAPRELPFLQSEQTFVRHETEDRWRRKSVRAELFSSLRIFFPRCFRFFSYFCSLIFGLRRTTNRK